MRVIQSVRSIALVLAAMAGLAAGASPAAAQGDLLVAPTRVIINNAGSAEVILSNIGNQPATYRISAELRRMDEDGDFTEVAEADANPAEKTALAMITFAPRRVTLLPGQPQSVRISIRPPEGVPDGEYRVHLNFRAVPPAVKADPADGAAPATGVTIKLVPVYGITIPVFVRRGRLDVAASIGAPKLIRSAAETYIELDLNRTGQRSVYGELIGKAADGTVLFDLRGVAVYPEVARRKLRIPVAADLAAKTKGRVTVEYRELPENGGALIAQTTATFP
ncbi:MAG: Fn3-like domain-containing protein [Novosphingobium sp.]|uniref:fimbrial biogenesis chaperone n=1 Tax=Novosphingobium sp. TaxID=1874826 RepID=UPI003C7CEF0C